MQKVHVQGYIKRDGKTELFWGEGWRKNNIFYPHRNNVRVFYKLVTCQKNWDTGIYAKSIVVMSDD